MSAYAQTTFHVYVSEHFRHVLRFGLGLARFRSAQTIQGPTNFIGALIF